MLYYVAVDGPDVYMSTEHGDILRVASAGGPATIVYCGSSAEGVAAANGYLYVATYLDGTIVRVSPPTAELKTLAQADSPFGLAVDGDSLLFSSYRHGNAWQLALTGGTPRALESAQPHNALGVAGNDAHLYVVESRLDINELPRAGGAPKALIAEAVNDGIFGVALDSTYLYWTATFAGNVMKIPLAGGAQTTVASGLFGVDGVAVDDASLYLTVNDPLDQGRLIRIEK